MWIALKPMIVTRDGKSVHLKPMEECPEAEFYPEDIKGKLERTRFIRQVPDNRILKAEEPVKVKANPAPVKVETEINKKEESAKEDDPFEALKKRRGRPPKAENKE